MQNKLVFLIEIDSRAITDFIRPELMVDEIGLALLKNIRRLMCFDFEFKVQYNFREGNRLADRLVDLEIDKRLDTSFFLLLLHILLGDKRRIIDLRR